MERIKNSAIQSINQEIKREKEINARLTRDGLYSIKADDSIIYPSSLIQLSQSIDNDNKDEKTDNDNVEIDLENVKKSGPPRLATSSRVQPEDDYLPKKEKEVKKKLVHLAFKY